MTCRPLLLLLLLLLGALLAAVTVTNASPAPQTSGDAAPTKTTQKTKLTTVRGMGEKKTAMASRGDSTKEESVAERPVAEQTTTTTTKRPATEATTTTTTSRPQNHPTARPEPASASKRPSSAKTTKRPPIKAPAAAITERIEGGRPTTNPPGFAAEVVRAPICALILNSSSLKTRKFRRAYLHGTTTCRCQNKRKAGCLPTTLYPTVRPGTASAAHAQEQSGSGVAQQVLAASIWAMRQSCERSVSRDTVCNFELVNNEPHCDCSVDE